MTSLKRSMVALDLSPMDKHLLSFFNAFSRLVGSNKIYFVHIMPDFSFPKNTDVEFHKLFAAEYPVDEKIRDKIELDVEENFGVSNGREYDIEVREGKPYEKLIHWADIKEIDLLAVGRKSISSNSGITAKRVARQANCNVLFVPENAKETFKNILIPFDFSDFSIQALKTGLQLVTQNPGLKLSTLYVVDLPPSEEYFSMTNTSLQKILVESAQENFNKFLKKQQLSAEVLNPIFIPNYHYNTALHLVEYATNSSTDLIIMGAKGHSTLHNLVFGSVTESLVSKNLSVPVLIVR